MATFLKHLKIHLIIFSTLILGVVLFVFVMSQFSTPHPDAYRDGIMSIVFVYAIIAIVLVLYYSIKPLIGETPLQRLKAASYWQKSIGIYGNIALLFAMITFVNSIMMVTGIDTPKTGTFAYGHLLIRLGIVTLAVLLYMYKEVIAFFKQLFHNDGSRLINLKATLSNLTNRPFDAVLKIFTTISITGCLIVVVFQSFITVEGGAQLYWALIIMFVVLSLIGLIRFIAIKTKLQTNEN